MMDGVLVLPRDQEVFGKPNSKKPFAEGWGVFADNAYPYAVLPNSAGMARHL